MTANPGDLGGMPPTPPNNDCRAIRFPVDTGLYTLGAIFRACYKFTDRCYLFLERQDADTVIVEFRARPVGTALLADMVGAFANELIDQRLRAEVATETRSMRDLIARQAFVEADLTPHESSETTDA